MVNWAILVRVNSVQYIMNYSIFWSAKWCSDNHISLPRRRSRVQIRPDAARPVTKLRISRALAGDTHSLARTPPTVIQYFGTDWLRVIEKDT